MALSDLTGSPSMDPAAMAALGAQFNAQDLATPPPVDPTLGLAHSAPAPSPAQYFASQPIVPPPAKVGVGAFPAAPGTSPPSAAPIPGQPGLAMMPGTGGARSAGFSPSTRTVEDKQAVVYSPDTLSAVGGALGARAELAGAQYGANAAQGGADAEAAQKLGLWDEATSAEDRLRRQHQLNEARDYHTKIQNLMEDAARDKVDPMKWWKDDMTGGQKALFALGAMVSGFGYGYSGRGINPAEVINQRIRDSVDAQKQAHASKLQGIGEARTQFGELQQLFGDSDKAALADEMAKRQAFISHLQQISATQQAPAQQRLAAANLASQLANDNANTLKELDEKQARSIATSSAEKYHEATNGAAGGKIGVSVTLEDGRRAVIPMDDAVKLGLTPKGASELRKEAAETRKTTAEAAVAEAKAAGTDQRAGEAQLNDIARDVTSTAYAPGRHFQGTESFKQKQRNDAYNAYLMSDYHASHPGIRITPEMADTVLGPYLIQPGDTEETVEQKKHLYMRSRPRAPGGGGVSGTDPGEGATPE